jgi:hypothetical protein
MLSRSTKPQTPGPSLTVGSQSVTTAAAGGAQSCTLGQHSTQTPRRAGCPPAPCPPQAHLMHLLPAQIAAVAGEEW